MITQTKQELANALKKISYVPHKIIGKLSIVGKNPIGREENDTCLLISPGASLDLTGEIILHRWVMIASGCSIINHSHPYTGREPLLLKEEKFGSEFVEPSELEICEDVWLFQSLILPQCTKIAKGVILGAGSVLTKTITEEYSIWAGNPARRVGIR